MIFWFSNESSNCLPVRRHNHIGCICLAFPHCVILWLVAGVWPTGRRIRRPKRGGRFPTKLPERRVGSTCTTRIGWGATTDVQRCNLHQATAFRGKQGCFFGHSTKLKENWLILHPFNWSSLELDWIEIFPGPANEISPGTKLTSLTRDRFSYPSVHG